MDSVGQLYSYDLPVPCYYVVVDDVVLMVYLTIVFGAVALVVDAILTSLLLRITVVDYSLYI